MEFFCFELARLSLTPCGVSSARYCFDKRILARPGDKWSKNRHTPDHFMQSNVNVQELRFFLFDVMSLMKNSFLHSAAWMTESGEIKRLHASFKPAAWALFFAENYSARWILGRDTAFWSRLRPLSWTASILDIFRASAEMQRIEKYRQSCFDRLQSVQFLRVFIFVSISGGYT
jgi:hypothetical protein